MLNARDADATPPTWATSTPGTSTPWRQGRDVALHNVFNSGAPVSSTKSAIGHLLGAAGAVEAVAALGAIGAACSADHQLRGRAECDLDYVPDGPLWRTQAGAVELVQVRE
jgi:3-oxoacyl-[acyl-carrier-protein] synthase II